MQSETSSHLENKKRNSFLMGIRWLGGMFCSEKVMGLNAFFILMGTCTTRNKAGACTPPGVLLLHYFGGCAGVMVGLCLGL
jgi:hypothetical protein